MDALLADYAAGGLPKSLHALVGSHLELNRKAVSTSTRLEAALASSVDEECALDPEEPPRPPRRDFRRRTGVACGQQRTCFGMTRDRRAQGTAPFPRQKP